MANNEQVEVVLNRLAANYPEDFINGALAGHEMGDRLDADDIPYKAPFIGLCDADVSDMALRYDAKSRGEDAYWPDEPDAASAEAIGRVVGYIARREELDLERSRN
jgi:hypothetical protein